MQAVKIEDCWRCSSTVLTLCQPRLQVANRGLLGMEHLKGRRQAAFLMQPTSAVDVRNVQQQAGWPCAQQRGAAQSVQRQAHLSPCCIHLVDDCPMVHKRLHASWHGNVHLRQALWPQGNGHLVRLRHAACHRRLEYGRHGDAGSTEAAQQLVWGWEAGQLQGGWGSHHSCKQQHYRQTDEWCMLPLHLLQDSRATSRTCLQVCSTDQPGQTGQPLTLQLQSPGDTRGCEG